MKRTLTLQIDGSNYRMSADADEAYLQKLAAVVNERIEALGASASKATPAQRLAIVALALADDLLQAEHRFQSLHQSTQTIVQGAIQRIDHRLANTEASAKTDP